MCEPDVLDRSDRTIRRRAYVLAVNDEVLWKDIFTGHGKQPHPPLSAVFLEVVPVENIDSESFRPVAVCLDNWAGVPFAGPIAMTPTLATALRDHRMASAFKDAHHLIFPSATGTPLDGRNMVRRYFEPALRRAKLRVIRFHDLRHTFASLLIAQGAHPKLIQEQLGHASIQITLDRYGHLMDQSVGDASDQLETALFGTASPAAADVTIRRNA